LDFHRGELFDRQVLETAPSGSKGKILAGKGKSKAQTTATQKATTEKVVGHSVKR
jgi:hypothetical protein